MRSSKILLILPLLFTLLSAEAQIFSKKKSKKKKEVAVGTVQLSNTFMDSLAESMIWVRGGKYTRGSAFGEASERPEQVITIDGFSISKYPVTQAQWMAVMGVNPSQFACSQCPIDNVSWVEAQQFILKLNQITGKKFTLPTEAEWEYAAKGGLLSKKYRYSGSDNIDETTWYLDNSQNKPHPVGLKQPNELGLYDMTGNVWEWCLDYFDPTYYEESNHNNPTGPKTGTKRVKRGGSWYSPERFSRSSTRDGLGETLKENNCGFRLALYPN